MNMKGIATSGCGGPEVAGALIPHHLPKHGPLLYEPGEDGGHPQAPGRHVVGEGVGDVIVEACQGKRL